MPLLDIERYSDRFLKQAAAVSGGNRLAELHKDQRYDKSLLPALVFDALLDRSAGKKKRGANGSGTFSHFILVKRTRG